MYSHARIDICLGLLKRGGVAVKRFMLRWAL